MRRVFEAGVEFFLGKPVERNKLLQIRVTKGPVERERRRFARVRLCCRVSYIVPSKRAESQSLLADVRQALWSMNPSLPLAKVRRLQQIYDKSLARTSFTIHAGHPGDRRHDGAPDRPGGNLRRDFLRPFSAPARPAYSICDPSCSSDQSDIYSRT
jgi:hypothetical protein